MNCLSPTLGAIIAILSCTSLHGAPSSRLVWQPVEDYLIHRDENQQVAAGTKRLNSFTAYTHLGSDFGFHGPAEHEIQWLTDEIVVHLGQQPEQWAGMWHSLAGQARDKDQVMDFTRAYPQAIQVKYQPKVKAVMIEASGRGRIKVEIKSPTEETRWSQTIEVKDAKCREFVHPVDPESVRDGKLIVWTAEPGAEITVASLRLGMEMPEMPYDAHVFLSSFAKMALCYSPHTGFVRDRAHVEEGAFESVSATGMYALASAAAAQADVGIVSQEYARWVLTRTHEAVSKLKKGRGLLPHFVRRLGEAYHIHPGTEYSSVDTALYAQSMLLAATMLNVPAVVQDVLRLIRSVEYDRLRLPDGHLSHGVADDGSTLLPHGWQDWGGETALVMLMEGVANPSRLPPPMRTPGKAWQGTGFIPEIQSLFHPDFDSDEPDSHDGVRWLSVRRAMLGAQRAYVAKRWPHSPVAKAGIYGLSAGENRSGTGYHVGGVDLPDQKLLHPHYVLMSAALHPQPKEIYDLLRGMEKAGYFPPWGLVENLTVDGRSFLPMNGALNAGFEALGAYHLLARNRSTPDAVYQASRNSQPLRLAMQLFYPQPGLEPVQTTAVSIPGE